MEPSGPRKPPWNSFRLRLAKDDEPLAAVYGGHPRGIRAHLWPRCAVCNNPMCHMAQIDAGPWADLNGWARMSLFICHATGGRCEDWDPWKGANRVVLQRVKDDNLYDGPPTVRVYRRIRLTVEDPVDERALITEAKETGKPIREALDRIKNDKLGGGAVWLHGDDTPKTEKGALRLVLQLTTELVAFDITKGGMAYAFIDPRDPSEHAGKLLWQGG